MEVREESGIYKIGGYINATERKSNVLRDKEGKSFVEVVATGVFSKALASAEEGGRKIPLMFRHKEILTQNVELREDSIGLRFDAEVDEATYNLVKEENLQCSFGFKPLKDTITNITSNLYKRVLNEIELFEVTLTPKPCYNGSLVECREDEDLSVEELIEIREALDVAIARGVALRAPSVEGSEIRENAQEEVAKQELKDEEEDKQEEKIENPIEVEIAKEEVKRVEAEVEAEKLQAEKTKKDILEKEQKLKVAQLKLELELLKLK